MFVFVVICYLFVFATYTNTHKKTQRERERERETERQRQRDRDIETGTHLRFSIKTGVLQYCAFKCVPRAVTVKQMLVGECRDAMFFLTHSVRLKHPTCIFVLLLVVCSRQK